MASEGPLITGAASDNAAVGTVPWIGANNAQANDGTDATATFVILNTSRYLLSTTFGFAIPSGATIDGIECSFEKFATGGADVKDALLRIYKGGSIGMTDRANTSSFWASSPAVATYGSSSDLWGETWTDSDINATNFGVALSGQNFNVAGTVASVDYVAITVHYTIAGVGQVPRAMHQYRQRRI